MVTLLTNLVNLASLLFSMYNKTPEEKRGDFLKNLTDFLVSGNDAITKSKTTGDTSHIEDFINSRIGAK
jgi:hypothetical protein